MARPTLKIEICFVNDPFTAIGTLTWVDVTAYWRGPDHGGEALTTRRGRQGELGRVEAGSLSLTLDNRDRRFDPTNSSSTYYPNVKPMKRVRVSATWNSVVYYLFCGYIESWEPLYPGGQDAMVRLRAADLLKPIGRTTVTITTIAPGELSGLAIKTALTAIGFPSLTDYTADGVGLTRIAPGTYANQNGLSYIGMITDTENGLFFVKGNGIAYFQDRQWRLRNTTSQATFGGGYSGFTQTTTNGSTTNSATTITVVSAAAFPSTGTVLIDSEQLTYTGKTSTTLTGATRGVNSTSAASHTSGAAVTVISGDYLYLPYESVIVSYDDQQIYNYVAVTRTGGTEQTASDTTSNTAYGPRTLSKSGLAMQTDTEALSLAQWLMYNYKDPIVRLPAITLRGDAHAGVWPQVLGREISDKITISRTPPGSGGAIASDVRIEQIAHSITAIDWSTTFQLSTIAAEDWMLLDSSSYGQLDSTHKLAF